VRPVDRLFSDYVAEHQAGRGVDPQAYLRQAAPTERAELVALIDGYLSRAPRRTFDPVAFRGSSAERTVDMLDRALAGESGLWPALLPELRHRAGLKRGELVQRLAAALGVAGREAKVGEYYHRMEQGRLTATGVSDRVLTALGELLGESAGALRTAGAALAPSAGPGDTPAFARAALADPVAASAAASDASAAAPDAADTERDAIDELFTGG
jgi:hypothetical protein